jgi:Flp pilus assembly protein TadD
VRTGSSRWEGKALHWIDRSVCFGLILLLVSTPLAFGSVHPVAFISMEMTIFFLTFLWMIKIYLKALTGETIKSMQREWHRMCLPAGALLMLICLQIVPLPMRLLQQMSPGAFEIHKAGVPVCQVGNLDIKSRLGVSRDSSTAFPRCSGEIPSRRRQIPLLQTLTWRTLSIAPTLTIAGFLEALSLAAIFFLVLLFRLEGSSATEPDWRFLQMVAVTIVATGVMVALVGLAELAWPQPNIHGLLIPGSVPRQQDVIWPRIAGPFINPDHYANYLAMIFPLAVVGSVRKFPRLAIPSVDCTSLIWSSSALLISAAIALSLSRGGWIAASTGACGVLALFVRFTHRQSILFSRSSPLWSIVPVVAGTLTFLVVLTYIVGPSNRIEIDRRLTSTLRDDAEHVRVDNWKDTTRMIMDFPIFGVGLGCWADLFPRYRRPPWSPFSFTNAENDYVQFAAETGVVGLFLLGWFALLVALRLCQSMTHVSLQFWPLYSGLLGGLCAGAVHEVCDFSFHIPANALLFTILLALALRIALGHLGTCTPSQVVRDRRSVRRIRLSAVSTAVAVLGLMIPVYDQHLALSYIGPRAQLATAEVQVSTHPGVASTHLKLAALLSAGEQQDVRTSQIRQALLLDPNDPQARDLYAHDLLLAGRKADGLRQITLSVFHAPKLQLHTYLTTTLLPWLLIDEQAAIERGFELAMERGDRSAIAQYADFCVELGRYGEAADIYLEGAKQASAEEIRVDYEINAGHSYALNHDANAAARILDEAKKIAPSDPRPYIELVRSVLAPSDAFDVAESVVEEGIRNGADPYVLESELANCATKQGNLKVFERSLVEAIRYQPKLGDILRLGTFYLTRDRFNSAILTLQKATELDPSSAEAFFGLGSALKATYDYSGAESAYMRANQLEPDNQSYRSTYEEFERQIATTIATGALKSPSRDQ